MGKLRNYSGGVSKAGDFVDTPIVELDPSTNLQVDQSPTNKKGLRYYGAPMSITEINNDILPSEYDSYFYPMYGGVGEPYLQKHRAQNQTKGEQVLGFLNQAIIGEIAGGSIESLGYMLDLETYGNLYKGTEEEFGNWFSNIGKSLRTWTEETTPIYTDPYAPKFDPGSFAWWMKNGKSVASTLSFLIPSGIAIKGLSTITKALGALQKISPMASWGAKGITQAAISRHMENMMEASGLYEEAYQKALQKGMSLTDAQEYAAKAAAKNYSLNWAMFLQDLPQYLLLNKSFGKGASKLVDQSLKGASMMGKKLLPIIGSKAAAIGWDMIGEGFEEGYQYIAQKEAEYLVDKNYDPTLKTSFDDRLNKYIRDGEFWTNVFFGAIGAGFMQTAGKAINTAIQGDPKVKFLKDYGSYISQAATSVNMAEILGSESAHKSAIHNLKSVLFNKGVQLDMMDDVKELIRISANPTPEDVERLGIDPKQLEDLGLNTEELLRDAEYFEERWNENISKYSPNIASALTQTEFTINEFNKLKREYKNKLTELEPNIVNFNDLSLEAQKIFELSAEVNAWQKKITFQEKRLNNPETGKREKDQIEKLIARSKKEVARLEKEIDIIDKSRTDEERAKDDNIDIGGPKNLLDVKDEKDIEKIENHVILEYRKLSEAVAFADEIITDSQQKLKELISGKKIEKTKVNEKEEDDLKEETNQNIPEPDDLVNYLKDGKTYVGIVNYVDENGDFVIIPKLDDNTYGEPITILKDNVTLINKSTIGEDLNEEPLDNEESPITYESIPTVDIAADISYMYGVRDKNGNWVGPPVINNKELHNFLVNPKNTLDGITAEFVIDDYSEFGRTWFKDNKLNKKDLTPDKLDNKLIDNIPIAIKLTKNNKVLFEGGMFYHKPSFGDADNVRRNRVVILKNLISGNKVYSDNLTKSFGHFNNTPWDRGNVLKRHGLTLRNAKIAVSRKNGKVYTSNDNTVANLTSTAPGSIFAPTSKTPNGREMWAKVNPTKLTVEHAEILWNAIISRYYKGRGGYMAQVIDPTTNKPDSRISSTNGVADLTAGEIINMLVLFGERKTNIDHPNYVGEKAEHLRNKTLYVHNGRELTFGKSKVDIFEDNMANAERNKKAFIEWATTNKNYSVPLELFAMGVQLNSRFNRTFKLGSWENKPNRNGNFKTYGQFLMASPVDGKDKYAIESDLNEFEDTGSVVSRPHLYLGDIKIEKSSGNKVVVPKTTKKSKDTKKVINKVKKTGVLLNITAEDIVNLPVGSIIYYKLPIIKDGKETGELETIQLIRIDRDPVIGRILNLTGWRSAATEKWHNLSLEKNVNLKTLEELIKYLRDKPHIKELLIDISNIAEEKTTVESKEQKEQEESEEDQINTGDSLEDLEDILNASLMEAWSGEVKSVVNLKKELKWFYSKFGKQTVKSQEKLIDLASKGKQAFGLFTADCIYIFKGAPEGVLYHEAFHRVLLGYLSESDRQAIYESARKEFNMPNASEYELSEKLAESFREYKLTNVKPKSRTIWQKFKDLLEFIYTFFTGNTRLTSFDINKLYDSIERGQFRYSKISVENARKIKNIESPMAVEIYKTTVPNINNYNDLNNIVKFLTAILIQTNEIDNLNDIKNIEMSKMFEYIDNENSDKPGLIQRLRSVLINGQKQIDSGEISKDKIADARKRIKVSENLFNILTIVNSNEYRGLFVDKISDMLVKLNVKRIVDEDSTSDSFKVEDYKKFYDKASYEINSKDNILASVKFLIATLPKSPTMDSNIGIAEFVDFNEMWNSIMHNLWDVIDTVDMMDRIKELSYQYPYKKLLEKLNKDKEGFLKEQLRTSVTKHKHDFINFLVNQKRVEGKTITTIEVTSADVSNAAKRKIAEWNLFFYSSNAISSFTMSDANINTDFIKNVYNKYDELTKKINKEYSKTKVISDLDGTITEFVDLLNSIGIKVDNLSIEELIKVRSGENNSDKLRLIIDSDFSYVFNKVLNVSDDNAIKIFNNEKSVRQLGEAYSKVHPEEISDSVLGPGGNLYYVYSQNSYVTDRIKQFKSDKTSLEDHSRKIYSDYSYYMNQLLSDNKNLDNLSIKTLSMFGKGTGLDYLEINPIEDYVLKLTALRNNLIPFPTLADRKTYYMLTGLKPFNFEYSVDAEGNLMLPKEAIDIFVGYAKSERNRIEEAKKVIKNYDAAKEVGNEERILEIEKQMVEGYHYVSRGKEKDTTKGSALQYHHFYSLNEKSKEKDFDFDRDIHNIVRETILNNIEAELEYVKDLGIIDSGFYNDKTYYFNIHLDNNLIQSEKEKYGNNDKAIRNIIAYNFINSTIASIEIEKIFSGDPAFYKVGKDTGRVHEDKIKRLTVMASTGDNFADSVPEQNIEDPSFNVVTLGTQNFKSTSYDWMHTWYRDKFKDQLTVKYAEEGIEKDPKEILNEAKIKATDKLSKYLSIDPSDGQAWISPSMYKSLSIRLGEWSNEKEEAFNLLQLDRELTLEEEQKTLNFTFQPLKLVYFNLIHEGNLAIPTYDKASFATIFRSMTKGKYGNRQISEMLDRMELKGKYDSNELDRVDMFKMDSAVKVGNRKRSYLFDNNLENVNDLSKIDVYKQPFIGLRRQLLTDTHDVDHVKTGTQFLKIVLANLNLNDKVYKLENKELTGREIANIAFNSLRSISNKGREELQNKLGYSNGRINKAKFIEMLKEDAKKSNASDDLIEALTTIGENELYLELDSLTEHKWIQSRIVSLISKYTIDIKLPGNQLIQFSNLGVRSIKRTEETLEEKIEDKKDHISWINDSTDEIPWMKLENGKVVPMGCIVSINLFKHLIPNYSKLTFKEKVKFLADNPRLMGYRIPTQGHNSIMMLKVVGVYPETIGDTITLPSEFTALTGSDFDIDKLYVTRYNYVVSSKNKLEKIKFIDGDTNDESVLKAIYKSRYGKIIGKWDWLNRIAEGDNLRNEELELLSQIVDSTDSDAVEDAILRIRTKNKYDKKALDDLNEYVSSLPTEEEFISKNKGKDIYEINSKKAVENRLLDSFFAIMSSEEHFTETSAPLGSILDILKKKAEAIRKADEKIRPDLYYASPRYNSYVKDIYCSGKNGVGPFALNNNHHVLSQLAGLRMKNTFDGVMYEDDTSIDLSQKVGKYDGIDILDWLSALIEAHVDVAKDPYITDLNVNSYTYNAVSLLLRGGVGEKTFDFISQPILRELSREYILSNYRNNLLTKRLKIDSEEKDNEEDVSTKEVDAVKYITDKWSKLLSEEELEQVNEISISDVFGDTLAKDTTITDKNNKEFIKRQLVILKAFTQLRDMGNDLNTLIQASQIDTKKFGSNITTVRAFLNKMRKAYNIDKFENIEKILPYDPYSLEEIKIEDANFLGTYANNSITLALKIFGELSIYGTDTFNELFDKLIKVTGNTYTIDEKFINNLSDELFAAIVSKFFVGKDYVNMNSKKVDRLFRNILRTLATIKSNKNGKYDNLKDNMFLKLLYLQSSKSELLPFPMFVSIPNKSTKDKLDKDNLINSFKELVQHEDVYVRDFVRRLVYFSFFTSGFRSRIYSFFNLIPNALMRELEIKNPNDPSMLMNISYNDMIKETLTSMKDITNVVEYSSLIDEVIINNHDNDNIVKLVSDKNVSLNYEFDNKTYEHPVSAIVSDEFAKSLFLGYNDSNKAIYRPYIKVSDDKLGHVLMKYIGYTSTETPDGISNTPVYISVNMRSYNSRGVVIREYFLTESIIPEYNKLNVIKNEEKFINSMEDDVTNAWYIPKDEQLVMFDEIIDEEETVESDTQLSLFDVEYTDIYSQLGNKTVSGNVELIKWADLKEYDTPIEKDSKGNIEYIISTRIADKFNHFGNPFTHDERIASQNKNLIKVGTTKEAVEKYIDWVINSQEDRAKWIRKQLQSGELKGKPILYYTELNEPSHATALDYLINRYDWSTEESPFESDLNIEKIKLIPTGISMKDYDAIIDLAKDDDTTIEQFKEFLEHLKKC